MKLTPDRREDRDPAHRGGRFFRALWESAPDALVVVDGRAEIVRVNEQAEILFGYRREELLGQPVELLVPERLCESDPGPWQRFFREPRVRQMSAGMALYGRRKDGTEFPVEISLSPLKTGAGVLVLSAIRDITERRAPEETHRQFAEAPLRNAREIEHELTLSEARYQRLTEASLDAIVTADRHGRITLFNPAAERMFGYRSEEVLNQPLTVLMPEEFRLPHECGFRRYLETREPRVIGHTVELRGRRKDGEEFPLELSLNPVEIAGAIQFIGSIRDQTEQQRAQGARLLSAIVESSSDGIISEDLDGTITSWNKSAERIFGYTAEEVVGKNLSLLIPPDQIGDLPRIMDCIRRGKCVNQYETQRKAKDGHIVEVSLTISPIHDMAGNIVGASKTARDISERKRSEAALQRYAEALARSNADLAQFAYVASHDLQAPLRTVMGFCQLFEKNYGDQFDERGKKWLRLLIQDSKNMQALIRGLLRFSRVETAGHPLEQTAASAAVQRALVHLRSTLEESGAQVTCDELPVVAADADQLYELFQNLIENAIKYRGGRPPRVRIAARRQGMEWVFSVRDNGIGIASEYHERIFGMFQRLHTQDVVPGTGIGLTLCRRIVERHGGKLWVESTPGEGSLFSFTLPAGVRK